MPSLPAVLKDMLALPTAPFIESAVLEYVRERCAGFAHVSVRSDRCGNLLARYRNKPRAIPGLVFTAHADHPGFVARRMLGENELLADFRGWVEPQYFVGTGVRFFSGGRWIRGRVAAIARPGKLHALTGRTPPPKQLTIETRASVAPDAPGMWDLPNPTLRGERVYARACDDVAGCASMIALLERLSAKRARADVYCLFTRAEEVGFVGAMGAALAKTLPRKLPIIAIETSKALPGARQGDGPILRVGDRASVFPPEVTAFCDRVAADLARRRKDFRYQRKLMDGGTCESTAYVSYGYQATGMCVALGNYHNMDERRQKIASEHIHLKDWEWMVDWFEAMALDRKGYGSEAAVLRTRLDKRYRSYEKLLLA